MTRFTGLGAKGVVIFQSPPPIPSSNDETKEEEKKAEKEVDKEEREEVDKEEKEDQELDVVDLTFKIFNQVLINPYLDKLFISICVILLYGLDERERVTIFSIYFQSFSYPIDHIFNHLIHNLNSPFFPSCSIYSTK